MVEGYDELPPLLRDQLVAAGAWCQLALELLGAQVVLGLLTVLHRGDWLSADAAAGLSLVLGLTLGVGGGALVARALQRSRVRAVVVSWRLARRLGGW